MDINEMNKLLVLQGIPASGKSTFAREFIKRKKDWIRVNRDDLRKMRGDYWIPSQELLITEIEEFIIDISLKNGYNVISDNTNLNPKVINRLKDIARINLAEIEFKKFDISLEEAISRDKNREFPVGENVIENFYNKYCNE